LIEFGARCLGPARKAAARGDLDRAVRLFGTAVLGGRTFAALSEERRGQVLANNIRAEYLTADHLPMPAEQLRLLATPALLVTGARSSRLFHRLIDRLDELLPNGRRTEIPAASHIVHEDNATDFAAAVRAFLAQQPPSRD
jgi:pimeloyl-ACP methyl ester carboxylesterase